MLNLQFLQFTRSASIAVFIKNNIIHYNGCVFIICRVISDKLCQIGRGI